jgi:hypothetical protein
MQNTRGHKLSVKRRLKRGAALKVRDGFRALWPPVARNR